MLLGWVMRAEGSCPLSPLWSAHAPAFNNHYAPPLLPSPRDATWRAEHLEESAPDAALRHHLPRVR